MSDERDVERSSASVAPRSATYQSGDKSHALHNAGAICLTPMRRGQVALAAGLAVDLPISSSPLKPGSPATHTPGLRAAAAVSCCRRNPPSRCASAWRGGPGLMAFDSSGVGLRGSGFNHARKSLHLFRLCSGSRVALPHVFQGFGEQLLLHITVAVAGVDDEGELVVVGSGVLGSWYQLMFSAENTPSCSPKYTGNRQHLYRHLGGARFASSLAPLESWFLVFGSASPRRRSPLPYLGFAPEDG